jgi:hypothetical protein
VIEVGAVRNIAQLFADPGRKPRRNIAEGQMLGAVKTVTIPTMGWFVQEATTNSTRDAITTGHPRKAGRPSILMNAATKKMPPSNTMLRESMPNRDVFHAINRMTCAPCQKLSTETASKNAARQRMVIPNVWALLYEQGNNRQVRRSAKGGISLLRKKLPQIG